MNDAVVPTLNQVSAGGVVYRGDSSNMEVVIVRVVPERRWQLPKGIIDDGETTEQAALREVREESGMTAEIVAPLETIEYWFTADWDDSRRRIHKFVHFFLMRHIDGDGSDHDHEVDEVRWVTIDEALQTLKFPSERDLVRKAAAMIGE
ncbi:MAG: NUDIX hydrolase [Acidobacteria bacterium]|nr:MAG: NUDIX hydrolase [Acidobacteriota bacterium]